jgi:hypothetical protein
MTCLRNRHLQMNFPRESASSSKGEAVLVDLFDDGLLYGTASAHHKSAW